MKMLGRWECAGLLILATSSIAADAPAAGPPGPSTARSASGGRAAPSFVNDVVPVLTRLGCNSGSCHGKLAGQNGFKLSLRGYAPELDYIAITREARGRRIAKSQPRESLLLAKPLTRVPHKGGRRLSAASPEYQTLLAWIASGAPGPKDREPEIVEVAVEPAARTYAPADHQNIKIFAIDCCGERRDVTRLALFASNEEGLATVDETGLVTAQRPGSTSIMASYQGLMAVHVVTTPYEQKVDPSVFADRVNFVDDHVTAKLREVQLPPSPPCDDAAFLRRVSLDLTGVLPEPAEVSAFLADPDPAKRAKRIDALLESTAFVDYWTSFWGEVFQNRRERDGDRRGRKGVRGFSRWIREQVRTNRPWDELAHDVLTAKGPLSQEPAGGYYLVNRSPEDVAEAATHAFMGTRIQCARCHNHPLERTTQDDYYGMAAFFSRVKLDGKNTDEGPAVDVGVPSRQGRRKRAAVSADRVGVTQPRTGRFLVPRPLDRSDVEIAEGQDPREALASWMTSPKNRTFSRAVVNRVWKRFMAVGLIEPVDDLRATNPASNEPLLQALCDDLVAHKFDLKHLMRTILSSRTYALSSEPLPANQADRKFFSHYYPRRLPAEVLADALAQAVGAPEAYQGYPLGVRAVQLPDPKVQNYFLDAFGRPERVTPCACERSSEMTMPQVLNLMNGESLSQRFGAEGGRIQTLLKAGRSDREIVDQLFLATVGREPTADQRAAVEAALKDAPDRAAVHRDLLWALVNSKEFLFGH